MVRDRNAKSLQNKVVVNKKSQTSKTTSNNTLDSSHGGVNLNDEVDDLDEEEVREERPMGKDDCRDKWRWKLQEDGKFTVKALAKMVEERMLRFRSDGQETIWNKWIPKKVNIFVWRALKGKIPDRVELDKRGIDLDSIL